MENEKLFLALRAGARAIVNNKRLHGTLYCWDIWGENGGPKEISYLEAATLLAETADKMEERPPERRTMDEYITPNYKTIGTVEQRKIRELYTSSLLNAFTQQDYLDAIALMGRVIDRLEELEK